MESAEPITHVIRTVLVANRGEIALRVMRTCARLGLRTVAIYTDARRRRTAHPTPRTEALRVPSPTSTSTPSSRRRSEAGADAIHPGYGFLSERAAFARAVEEAGLRLVGPSRRRDGRDGPQGRRPRDRGRGRRAGRAVVRRRRRPARRSPTRCWSRLRPAAAARACASSASPTSTTRRSPPRSARRARRSATTRCWSRSTSSPAATSRCRCSPTATATSSTSSSATARPSAGTRRCSRRRRRPTIDADVRHRLTSAAVALAKQVGYTNAGTVEFLLDHAYRRVLLPGDEHPAPGRAPGHRGGHRPRPGRARSSASRPASRCRSARRTCHARRATRSRRGSTPRTPSRVPAPGRHAPAW